jgi:AGZA family xanthine/uracil permease-like MFS transporter
MEAIMSHGQGIAASPAGESGLERFFHLREHGTDVRTEVLAGLTTFVVMAYIIAVNPSVLAAAGLDVRAVATSTCLVAGVLSIVMGLYTNRAFAIAPGLGLNAIVAYNLVGTMGLTPAEAMGVVVVEGVLITILVLLGVRKYVMDVVPTALSRAISVGIGFFILFIGLRNTGAITFLPGQTGTVDGLLTLTPLNTWPIFVAMVGLAVTIILMARGFRAAILAGIVIATIVAFIVPGQVAQIPAEPMAGPDFSLIGQFSLGFFAKLGLLTAVLAVISFMLSDFFDTMGTLIGVGSEAGYLNKKGELEDSQRPLLIDSLGAVAGGAVSASSATTYIESAAGVAAGGRTGLVAVVTGILFLLALPFVALVNAIPAVATAPALIVVGVLMVGVLSEGDRNAPEGAASRRSAIDFRSLDQAIPVVLTMLVMPLTFSITNGIGAGFVSYVLVKLASGKGREVHPALYVVAGLFLLYFLRWALFDAQF